MNESIINYLKETYQPEAIIVYGSYADGTMNKESDFDALVIAKHEKKHDSSVVDGVVLDVFICPVTAFSDDYDPKEFIQIYNGKVILDTDDTAAKLMRKVADYVENMPRKTSTEIMQEVEWCRKMLSRAKRHDVKGYYRWHWLLVDSLEIYCDVRQTYYPGPKKALQIMENSDKEAYSLFSKALENFKYEYLTEWVDYLTRISQETI